MKFKGGKSNKEGKLIVKAPVEGTGVTLKKVDDAVFSDELMGKGMAILPEKGRVVSPVNGKIASVFETKHAITIISDDGIEILIHVGLETVNLQGEHFNSHVQTGDHVKVGDLLLEFELEEIINLGYDPIIPVIICNTPSYSNLEFFTDIQLKEADKIMALS